MTDGARPAAARRPLLRRHPHLRRRPAVLRRPRPARPRPPAASHPHRGRPRGRRRRLVRATPRRPHPCPTRVALPDIPRARRWEPQLEAVGPADPHAAVRAGPLGGRCMIDVRFPIEPDVLGRPLPTPRRERVDRWISLSPASRASISCWPVSGGTDSTQSSCVVNICRLQHARVEGSARRKRGKAG